MNTRWFPKHNFHPVLLLQNCFRIPLAVQWLRLPANAENEGSIPGWGVKIPLSSCLQSFQVSGYFPVSQFFASGGQSIAPSTSASFLAMNIKCSFPLELTGLISLLSKGVSRIFSISTTWKHPFFSAQYSLWSNSQIHTRTGTEVEEAPLGVSTPTRRGPRGCSLPPRSTLGSLYFY